jgi:two-component system CheB/CheR fusion protein
MPDSDSPDSPPASDAPGDEGLATLSPDHSEVGSSGDMEAILPIKAEELLPVVGLGGSAGSIGPLREFFSRMPADSGMGFVVVVHLSPEHESILASVLGNVTAMVVVQVTERVKIEPNCVYVIPPGKQLSMEDGHLQVIDLQHDRGRRVVVDLLLRTLADTHGPRAMAVVLSGADGDGAIGIKRIKERGGLTIVQEPNEAEHEGMPRSSIATGMIDWVLPVAEIPARLLEYRHNEERLRLPLENPAPQAVLPQESDETALRETLAFLRMRTGRDFSYYKRGTILRRIGRRMQVNSLESLSDYLAFLRTHPGEAGALLQDLLISVTNFFRDRESFDALKSEMTRLFKVKKSDDQVRVWVAGCATGEEAYSVAMLLCEYAAGLDDAPALQVFATDIDENAIRTAREGFYPSAITADVSPERLRRFFSPEPGGYRVKRAVRETVLFAPHDLLKDSPFSRLDLVSCRNLLIYLRREAQTRAFDIIHFALRSEGLLFLGGSESAENALAQFTVLNKKHRLYTRRYSARQAPPLFTGPSSLALAYQRPITSLATARAPLEAPSPTLPDAAPGEERPSLSFGESHFNLLERFSPPSVIIDANHRIVHLSEHAGRYVQFSGGEPTTNLLRAVHPMLRLELRAALFRVAQSGHEVEITGVPVEIDGKPRAVDLRVYPAASDLQLVVFGERDSQAVPEIIAGGTAAESVTPRLERELESLEAQQRDVVEQYEASVEELKASNEELQAMNEELRSATEELETSREELQSINEELITVNQELKGKIEEIDRTNSDLQNLMASTQIATVFLDRELCIKRFTPSAVPLFNLISTDVGRPLSDLTHRLNYPGITADAQGVLDRLVPVEREISTTDDRWFIAQIVPYRTADDRIAGLVLTFVDITTRKKAEQSLRQAGAELDREVRRFDAVVSSVPDFIFTFDLSGRLTFLNKPLLDLWQTTLEQAVGKTFAEIDHLSPAAGRIEQQIRQVIDRREPVRDEMSFAGDGVYDYILVPILGADGAVEAVAGTTRDITARKRAEEELRTVKDELASELGVMTRLHGLGTRLLSSSEMRPLLEEILDAAIELQQADFGSIQLGDQASGRLTIVAQRGFSQEVIDYFNGWEDQQATCGDTVGRERIVIEDVAADPACAVHRKMAVELAGYRATQSTPLFDRAGSFLGLLSTYFRQPHRPSARDLRLTDLYARQAAEIIGFKLAEEKVRTSEERYRLIFESATDFAILTLDLAGIITSWNPGARMSFGYEAAEIVGEPFAKLFTGEDRAAGHPEEELTLAEREGAANCDRWHVRRDGRQFWGSGVLMAMTENGRRAGFLKILRDTTAEREAMEDRLLVEQERARLLVAEQHARREAEAANEAKDRFLAILSHELRTPLAPIHMTLYTLEHERRLTALGRESLGIIRRSVEMEVRLIDDLLDVSRIVHGKLQLALAPVDLHACVLRAVDFCRDEVENADIKLETALEASPAEVMGDAARLQQVFWNLLKNAAKFSPSGGLITVRSRTTRREDGPTGIVVEVADTGIGIEPEMLPKLFIAFEQGGPDIVRRHGGLGLGLAIASGIVQSHGGVITAASQGRDKGTVMSVELVTTEPIRKGDKANRPKRGE